MTLRSIMNFHKKQLPEKIESSRIYLMKHPLSLAPKLFSCLEQNRDRLREFLPWVDPTRSENDTLKWLQITHDLWEKFCMFDYGIYLKESQEYLGSLGVHTISWENQRCELGFWIRKEFEGQGYISEGIKALEKVCFQMIGFHRIEIRCSGRNALSAYVASRCGYKFEGRLREEALEMGQFRDTLVFSKLESDV